MNFLLVYRRDGCLFGADNFPITWKVFTYFLCNTLKLGQRCVV